MSETENVEQGASSEAVDYSRPVGWWCPVCGSATWFGSCHGEPCIPVYLPIPKGQRPLVEDEVESAEVVTWTSPNPCGGFRIGSNDVAFTAHGYAVGHWFDESEYLAHTESIANELAQASARARTGSQHVTGATE